MEALIIRVFFVSSLSASLIFAALNSSSPSVILSLLISSAIGFLHLRFHRSLRGNYHTCGLHFRPLILSVVMLSKELATLERVQPSFIEPMQVTLVRELPDGRKWSYEAKLDGYRCLAARRSSGVALWSRRANGFTAR